MLSRCCSIKKQREKEQMEYAVKKKNIRFSRADLKWIAAGSMVLDHIGCVLVSAQTAPVLYYLLRILGRISFPCICFMLVEGIQYTKDRKRYLLRLLVFALLSEIPFDLAINRKIVCLGSQNVLFTLAIGMIVVVAIEKIYRTMEKFQIFFCFLVMVAGILLAYILHTDYSYWGVVLILTFYYGKYRWQKWRIGAVIFLCAIHGGMEVFAALALFFTENYDPKRAGKIPKRFFYWFYSLHLLVLSAIRAWVN